MQHMHIESYIYIYIHSYIYAGYVVGVTLLPGLVLHDNETDMAHLPLPCLTGFSTPMTHLYKQAQQCGLQLRTVLSFFFIILYTLISIVHIFVLYDYSIIEAYM